MHQIQFLLERRLVVRNVTQTDRFCLKLLLLRLNKSTKLSWIVACWEIVALHINSSSPCYAIISWCCAYTYHSTNVLGYALYRLRIIGYRSLLLSLIGVGSCTLHMSHWVSLFVLLDSRVCCTSKLILTRDCTWELSYRLLLKSSRFNLGWLGNLAGNADV